ncbi:MAG: hypothetical protein ACRCX2_30740, partial [Paraclostridium sp.]
EDLKEKWKSFVKSYSKNKNNAFYMYTEIKDILEFIKVFYEWKNRYELKKIKTDTRLKELLKYFDEGKVGVVE